MVVFITGKLLTNVTLLTNGMSTLVCRVTAFVQNVADQNGLDWCKNFKGKV